MNKIWVAIDEQPLIGADAIRGIGFHTRELVNHLREIEELNIEVVNFKTTDLSKFDIVHYQFFHPHFMTLPFKKPNNKVVVTIHDLIRLIYPDAYPPGIKGSLRFFLQKINLRNVDAIITISETSKKDIVRFLNVIPEKVFVTYLAPQSALAKSLKKKDLDNASVKYKLPKRFVLYIGDVNFNKNLIELAKACKIADMTLVIVGKQSVSQNLDQNVENSSWRQFLEIYGKDPRVLRLGFLESREFEAVFNLASVYCQPSLYEGFGMPLLEAFQRELPVVATRTQALVEVGGEAALFVESSAKGLANGIIQVVNDTKLKRELVDKGKMQLKKYSWQKTAHETFKVYKKVLSMA